MSLYLQTSIRPEPLRWPERPPCNRPPRCHSQSREEVPFQRALTNVVGWRWQMSENVTLFLIDGCSSQWNEQLVSLSSVPGSVNRRIRCNGCCLSPRRSSHVCSHRRQTASRHSPHLSLSPNDQLGLHYYGLAAHLLWRRPRGAWWVEPLPGAFHSNDYSAAQLSW